MNRSILALAIALLIVAPSTALAQAPTTSQLEMAKKAFGEGKKAFEAGDFPEAIAKFKASYNLSKKPTLLYNIALSNQSAGQDDIALFYFRKFLTEADPADAQRPDAEARTKDLEKKFGGGANTNTTPPNNTNTTPPPNNTTTTPEKAKPLTIKPPGTYKPEDFQHIVVDTAPPKKPLDVTASVPEDSGWVVTLNYRTAGEGKFTPKVMKWRYKELIARVPPDKMLGDSMQYYIEVKDQAGTVVTRSGKSTSPNLVTLEAGASPRFYPDWSDEGGGVAASPQETQQSDTEEDPLNKNKNNKQVKDVDTFETGPEGPTGPANGIGDVGSKKFNFMKWGTTGAAGVFVGLSVFLYISAGNQARALEEDIVACGTPPCREFDQYAKDVEAAGKRNQTLSRVTLVFGVGSAAIAGYFWYKQMKAKPRTEVKPKPSPAPTARNLHVVPAIGEGFAGAAAGFEF